ncbi:MAG TPA: hypothetical protein PLP39_07785 [Flavobacterium lutivivi]|nr:hypothetical protein [Flavobacterium lutivivi]
MKKLFFSAIALVAFSGVSMANTIEVEDVDVSVDCNRVFSSTRIYMLNQGFTQEASNVAAFAAYDKCMGCEMTECSSK